LDKSNKERSAEKALLGRSHSRYLLFLLAGAILACAGSLFTAVAVKKTSGAEFCGSCHSMNPVVASYYQDVHGGKNRGGVVVQCVDCHLPHDGVVSYMSAKAALGLHDIYVENFGSPEDIDWNAKRKRSEEYVYDSGCLKCHGNFEESTMANPKAFIAHKDYSMGASGTKCVSCHENVGHKNLGLFLKEDSSTRNTKRREK